MPDLSNGITLFRDLANGINTTDGELPHTKKPVRCFHHQKYVTRCDAIAIALTPSDILQQLQFIKLNMRLNAVNSRPGVFTKELISYHIGFVNSQTGLLDSSINFRSTVDVALAKAPFGHQNALLCPGAVYE